MAKRFLLRLNENLFEEIRRWSADDLRSVNGQIEYLLKQALRQRRRSKPEEREPPAQ